MIDLDRDAAFDEREHLAWAVTASRSAGRLDAGVGWQREIGIDGQHGGDRSSVTAAAALELRPRARLKSQLTLSDSRLADADAWQWALSLERAVSERALVYLAFSRTINESSAAFSSNNCGKGRALFTAAGEDPWAVSLWLSLSFEQSFARKRAFTAPAQRGLVAVHLVTGMHGFHRINPCVGGKLTERKIPA